MKKYFRKTSRQKKHRKFKKIIKSIVLFLSINYINIFNKKNSKQKKVVNGWINILRQIAPKLYRKYWISLCYKISPWRKGKRISNKVKFIINNDSLTGIDIHDINDIKIAEHALKLLKEKKKIWFLNKLIIRNPQMNVLITYLYSWKILLKFTKKFKGVSISFMW